MTVCLQADHQLHENCVQEEQSSGCPRTQGEADPYPPDHQRRGAGWAPLSKYPRSQEPGPGWKGWGTRGRPSRLHLANRQQETSLSQAQEQADLWCHLSKPLPWGPAVTSPGEAQGHGEVTGALEISTELGGWAFLGWDPRWHNVAQVGDIPS